MWIFEMQYLSDLRNVDVARPANPEVVVQIAGCVL